jgi:lipoate-protein ligase A
VCSVVKHTLIDKMLIVESQSLDVYRNLAIEEYLMDQVVDRGSILFLWRSDQAVVIGKNQNPWRECRLDLMRSKGVPLARRISGGGAVYHDEGNLNYCVITDRTRYRKEQAYEMVLRALDSFGVKAEQTGKSNLSVDNQKISGNAFCFRRGRALHHGTLLLDTSLELLDQYLGSMFEHIDTKAIASEPAEVMNLELDVGEVSAALIESFHQLYSDGREPESLTDLDLLEEHYQTLLARQNSRLWQFDNTPKFVWEQDGRRVEVEHGVVVAAKGQDLDLIGGKFSDIAYSLVC